LLVVIRSDLLYDLVYWRCSPDFLGEFLESGLGIDEE
jgi:hypothetical protein